MHGNPQLDDNDLLHEHWWGIDHRNTRRVTHLPSGISVTNAELADLPPYRQHVEMRSLLAQKVAAWQAARNPDPHGSPWG
jgi:hypothetical protein